MNAPVSQVEASRAFLVPLAKRNGLDVATYEATIKATCMPQPFQEHEFIACMLIAVRLDLDPIAREILFTRAKQGHVQPLVGMDGWITLAQRHDQFKGYTFKEERDATGNVIACTGIFHRADWAEPLSITEYMAECKGTGDGWDKTPIRMLRNRTLTQGVRLIVGVAGVMAPDEFYQWQASAPGPQAPVVRRSDPTSQVLDLPEGDGPETTPVTDTRPTDEVFITALESALIVARDEASITEIWECNEAEISERGLEQQAHDLRDHHLTRVRSASRTVDGVTVPDDGRILFKDHQDKPVPVEPEGHGPALLDLPGEDIAGPQEMAAPPVATGVQSPHTDADAAVPPAVPAPAAAPAPAHEVELLALDLLLTQQHSETRVKQTFRSHEHKMRRHPHVVIAQFHALLSKHIARVRKASGEYSS